MNALASSSKPRSKSVAHVDRNLASVLRALARRRLRLRFGPAAQIGLGVARGLVLAHEMTDDNGRRYGIVHGHINPAAVILTGDGRVKLAQFDPVTPGPRDGQRAAAVAFGYASPEQARGQSLDGRSDVFSLGAVMWEMLTGQRLFADAAASLRARIVAPSSLRPSVPAQLDRIVLRALARDRNARFASARDMAVALEYFLTPRRIRPDAVRHVVAALFDDAPASNTGAAHTPRVHRRAPGQPTRAPAAAAAVAALLQHQQHADVAPSELSMTGCASDAPEPLAQAALQAVAPRRSSAHARRVLLFKVPASRGLLAALICAFAVCAFGALRARPPSAAAANLPTPVPVAIELEPVPPDAPAQTTTIEPLPQAAPPARPARRVVRRRAHRRTTTVAKQQLGRGRSMKVWLDRGNG